MTQEIYDNPAFSSENSLSVIEGNLTSVNNEDKNEDRKIVTKDGVIRQKWGRDIEFLLSCIAMAIGLGNVWRFPFIALENGGGAFVIPYIIVLILIGKPGYYLEMIMGQFSSRGTVKVYDCVPAMRGVGLGQMICLAMVATYYSAIVAIILYFLIVSFFPTLPWSECKDYWDVPCYSSSGSNSNITWNNNTKSSAELYFLKDVLNARDTLEDGIGLPNWNLVGLLVFSWTIMFILLFKGVRITGKASYVTGTAPFIFLAIFFIRAITLEGSYEGIAYFFKPKWNDILKPKVWFEACTQVFFTLNVFFVNVIMCASYNRFEHKIQRDSAIVTTLDTFTSLLVGSITFGIVGHLSHELNRPIKEVFRGGPGLVFVTYPETIAKFKFWPQFFSVMFFLMLFILSFGSLLATSLSAMTVIRDRFKRIKDWQAALGFAIFGTIFGCFYTTPAGLLILNLVDSYCATFVIFILACLEIYTFSYIYGVARICKDVKFMLGFRPNIFWRVTWKFITPLIMTAIVIYTFVYFELPSDGDYQYPVGAHIFGWFIALLGLIWVPVIFTTRVWKQKQETKLIEKIRAALRPTKNWGPLDPVTNAKYKEFMTKN
ncbi:hypothetical protein PVAND_000684 [Polypedilum vanderplanki]|uniref:Transporter n=1 Tax=Polypedilum vanderplanki TaxID=319348 RepID=A0A9J6BKX7_POLVA|nr:hypothetical protein PVAND_000684 [Polypedilum vanderplanki]